jgi:hypothetical protein
MQYQAVIDTDEIIFVDNHGHAVQDGKGGGRLIGEFPKALDLFEERLKDAEKTASILPFQP